MAGSPSLRSVRRPEAPPSDGAWIDGWTPDVDRPARELVRADLYDLLDQADTPVVVVCAPVGYGKSTLVRQWLERPGAPPCTWVPAGSQSSGAAVAASVQRGLADLAETLGGTGGAPIDLTLGTRLADALRGLPESVLVVDGVRRAEALTGIEPIAAAVATAAGCGLRVVATTRARPTDALARLLARGSAALVSEDDLALDLDRATELVSAIAGRPVEPVQVDALLDEVGGWTAGLAAIARGWRRATTDAALAHRLRAGLEVLDEYVLGEVLDDVGDDLRALVVELGHLPVLAPDLCDQLLGRDDSAELLGALRAGGGMVGPGEHDGWLEVHPALRGAARRRAHDRSADRRGATDDAAVAWYLAQGEPILAVRLLAEAGRWDDVRTAAIDEIPTLLRRGQIPQLTRLLRLAPLDFFQVDWTHLNQYAFFELSTGNVNRALQLLNEMERFLPPRGRFGANLVRSAAGVYLPDPRPAIAAGEAALAALPEVEDEIAGSRRYYIGATGDHYRVMLTGHLLVAGAIAGEWRRVAHHRSEVPPELAATIAPSALIGALGNRAVHLALAGELVAAEEVAERALAASVEGDAFIEQATANARFARGELRRAGGDWAGAIPDLVLARDQAVANHRVLLHAIAAACLAHAHLDGGDVDRAEEVLHDVQVVLFDRARTLAGALASARARVLLSRGDPEEALRALRSTRPTPMSASECVAIALQVQDLRLAESLVDHWPADPTVDNRVRRGLAMAAVGSAIGQSEGTEGFHRAVALAAKHGLAQPVVRLAEPLHPLLRATARKGRSAAARLCQDVLSSAPAAALPGRQLAVMRLLEEGLTLPEIAAELHISVSMVKKHTRAIYKALGATNRAEAVLAWTSEGSRS
jgi:LuxR family maltose regulon positive regulatory protein